MSEQESPARLSVQYRTVKSLIPYAKNARKHSSKQVAQIAASIKEFGWTAPILVDGDNGIIAGHGRLAAAKKLEMAEVPVIELSGLTELEKRTYIIADNQLALDAEWDNDALASELLELDAHDFDLTLLGFTDVEALMGEEKPARGMGAPSMQYNLIFENESQRMVWFGFIRKIKLAYPDVETLGERLFLFLNEGKHIVAR